MLRLKVTMDEQIAVLAVAEKGSYEAAGKYLGITKSAVRKRVLRVGSQLGTPVFQLEGKGMVPTEAGNVYLPGIRESVRHASLAVDRVRGFVRVQANDLRIGYSSHLHTKLLAIIAQLQAQNHSSVPIQHESLLTQQVVASVLQGHLQVGFGFLPIREPELFTQQLMEEPLMVCLQEGHRLGAKRAIQPEELENEALISVARKALPGTHDELVGHFESLGIALRFVADAYLSKEALWMVGQGVGFALMTRSSATPLPSGIVVRPLLDRLLTEKSGLFARHDHGRNGSSIKQFVERAWAETAVLRAAPPQ